MARRLGTAYVGIEADASLFRATAMAGMKKAMAGLEGKIPVTADLKKARADIGRFLAELQMMHPDIEMGLDADQAKRVLSDFRGRIGVLAAELDRMRANPDLAHSALGQVTRLQVAVRRAAADLNKMKPNARNLQDFENRIIGIENSWDRVTASVRRVAQAEQEAAARLRFFQGLGPEINTLSNRIRTLGQSMDVDVVAGARRAQAALSALGSRKFEISPAGFTRARSDLAAIVASVSGMETRIKDASDAEAVLNARTAESARLFAVLQPRIKDLTERLAHMRLGFDNKEAQVAIDGLLARLARIRHTEVTPENFLKMVADLGRAELAADKVVVSMEKVAEAEREATAQADFFARKIEPGLAAISEKLAGLKAGLDDKVFLSKIADMEAAVARFRARKISFDDASMKAAEAELGRLATRTEALGAGIGNLNDRLTQGRVSWFGWVGGLLQARVALYAGYRQVTGWHIALDSVVEVLAILVPALVVATAGIGAFAAAAYLAQDTLTRIGQHMKYVQIVSEATGKAIPPLTNHFDNMAKVIRPQVFQLLGAALGGAGSQMQIFDKLAIGTGAILDRWAARVIVDMQSSQGGINKFITTGEFMLQKLGIIAQNVGHIISQLIQVATKTHIAEGIITAVAAFSQLLSVVSNLPVPLLAAVTLFHGLYLWGGLFTSLMVKTILGPIRGLANLAAGAKLAGVAVKSLNADDKGFKRMSAYVKDIRTGFSAVPARVKALGSALKLLAASPWTWVAVGVAALVVLGVWLSKTKTASYQFVQSMDEMTKHATMFNIINVLGAELIQTNEKLTGAQKKLNDELKKGTSNTAAFNARFGPLGTGVQAAASAVNDYSGAQKKAFGEMLLGTQRLSGLSDQFGTKGLAGAMALAALAGVKVETLIKGSAKDWAIATQQIQDLVNGYKAMGQGANQIGSDLNALTVAGSSQLKSIGQLNDAYDTFTKIVSAPISGFLSFTQTIQRFSTDAQAAGAHMSGLGGAIETSSKKVRSSSVQLQMDFQDTFNSAEQLFDAMRSSQAPAAIQVDAIHRAVEALIPMAGSNKAAAAEVSALAQEAGGPATTNLQQLAKWAGHTHDPLKKLNDDANTAAIGFYNLSQDAQRLGTALSQDLTADMAKAIEQSVGLQGAMQKYADALQHGTDTTAAGRKARKALYDDLVEITGSGQRANEIIQAMEDRIKNHSLAITDTQKQRKQFNDDLKTIIADAPQSAADIGKLADAVVNHGLKSEAYKDARKKLIDDLKQSGIDAQTATGLVDGLGTSVFNLSDKGSKGRQARQNLITDIIQAGRAAGESNDQIATMIGQVLKIPKKAAMQIIMTGTGSFKISQQMTSATNPYPGGISGRAASGMFITAGTGPTADDVPILASKGEYVVRASSVAKYGKQTMDRINAGAYADGGLVKGGARSVLDGTFATATADRFKYAMLGSEVLNMRQAMMAAEKAAIAVGSAASVLAYAESFRNKAPYVWGGSTPAGWDCSGFVSYVLEHFKLLGARMDAQGLQSWAKPSTATPGGLAFYGNPAHHVGFVVNNTTLLSALGKKYGTIESSLSMGDNSGYGVPPQGYGAAGSGGPSSQSAIQELAYSMLQSRGWGVQWPAFNSLEVREAGWRLNAANPSGAYGLAQFINGPSEYYQYGGNPNTAQGQLTAMMNYIAQRYGDPNAAWAHEIAKGFYARGGMVGVYDRGGFLPTGASIAINNTGRPERVVAGYATGGEIPAAKYVPQLKAAQAGEVRDYRGLVAAYRHDLAVAKKGSWTAGHRAGITSELGTLAKRQATESAAYNAIIAHGTSKSNLTHLASGVKGVVTVSHDIDLRHSHPGWSAGLWGWLGKLSNLSKDAVAPTIAGTAAKMQFGPWLAKLKAAEKDQEHDLFWLNAVFYRLLKNAKPGSWLRANQAAVKERLYAIAVKDNAEDKAYKDLLAHSTGSAADLTAMTTRIGAVNAAASAEAAALQPALIGHAGGSPYWTKQVQQSLGQVVSLTGNLPFMPPWAPGNLGAAHTVKGGVLKFDRGGWLPTGLSLSYNGTGRPEPVGAPNITIEFSSTGNAGFDAFLMKWIKETVRVQGHGSVQSTFGRR